MRPSFRVLLQLELTNSTHSLQVSHRSRSSSCVPDPRTRIARQEGADTLASPLQDEDTVYIVDKVHPAPFRVPE